jgi:hypothetical protein
MTEQDKTLVSIMAATDAIFRPMRAADWTAPNAVQAARRVFV